MATNIENLSLFHETALISAYPGTLFDISFYPKEKYTDLSKFLGDLRTQVYVNLIECQSKTPAIRVFFSIDIQHDNYVADYKSITSKGRCTVTSDVEALMEHLYTGINTTLSKWIADFAYFDITSVLSANLHIVADSDKYGTTRFDLSIVRRNYRFGPKLRHSLIDKWMIGTIKLHY